ncbi:hypothetical protein MTO96_051211 [Rhipicephalus appendiculatus]
MRFSKARHHEVPETNDTGPLHATNHQHHQPLSSSQPATASQTDQTAALLLTPSRRLLPVVCCTPCRLRTRLRRREASRQRRARYRSATPTVSGRGLNYRHRRSREGEKSGSS